MEKKINIGIVGAGMGGDVLTFNEDKNTGLYIKALCDINRQKVDFYKNKYNLEMGFTDYEEMLKIDDIDVIAVYTPDYLHCRHCTMALNAGKHVICTKPMATSNDESQQIVDLVRKTKKRFLLAATARVIPPFLNIKNYIDNGFIGEIFLARGQYIHDMSPYLEVTPWRFKVPQDMLIGGGVHPFDLLMWYMGDKVDEVFAYSVKGETIKEYPLDDNIIISLKFNCGAIAQVSIFNGIIEEPEPEILPIIDINLFGRTGTVTGCFSESKGGDLKIVSKKFDGLPTQKISYFAQKEEKIGSHKTLGMLEKRHFLAFEKCLEENIDPSPDAVEGARAVAVGVAAWESINKKRPVKVKNDF